MFPCIFQPSHFSNVTHQRIHTALGGFFVMSLFSSPQGALTTVFCDFLSCLSVFAGITQRFYQWDLYCNLEYIYIYSIYSVYVHICYDIYEIYIKTYEIMNYPLYCLHQWPSSTVSSNLRPLSGKPSGTIFQAYWVFSCLLPSMVFSGVVVPSMVISGKVVGLWLRFFGDVTFF